MWCTYNTNTSVNSVSSSEWCFKLDFQTAKNRARNAKERKHLTKSRLLPAQGPWHWLIRGAHDTPIATCDHTTPETSIPLSARRNLSSTQTPYFFLPFSSSPFLFLLLPVPSLLSPFPSFFHPPPLSSLFFPLLFLSLLFFPSLLSFSFPFPLSPFPFSCLRSRTLQSS